MKKENAVALVTVLISITILTIIAGIALTLMTSQARLVESQVRRIKALYTAEGMMWAAIDNLRTGNGIFGQQSMNRAFVSRQNQGEGLTRDNNLTGTRVEYSPAADGNNTLRVNVAY